MRSLKFLLIKEFRQIFRNKSLLPIIFIMPVIQLLIVPLAADYEVKNINITIVDNDLSSMSQLLSSKISASNYFKLVDNSVSYDKGFKSIETGRADLMLTIPANFEREIYREGSEKVFIAINAINGTKAALGGNYLNQIIADFNRGVQAKSFTQMPVAQINIMPVNWFNPYLNYKVFMVPAILVILVTMVGAYMCALNIVKEKEVGTIEQINVSPIKKHHYILGKMIPFWIIGLLIFSVGFFPISWGVYGIVPQGSLLLLYGFLALFLIAILGFGLIISTYSETQMQAMSISFFFMMIFILMGGLFTSVDSMPVWAQYIAKANPVTYFIDVVRMIVLKGSTLKDIAKEVWAMLGFAIFFNTWAVFNYRKTS